MFDETTNETTDTQWSSVFQFFNKNEKSQESYFGCVNISKDRRAKLNF